MRLYALTHDEIAAINKKCRNALDFCRRRQLITAL